MRNTDPNKFTSDSIGYENLFLLWRRHCSYNFSFVPAIPSCVTFTLQQLLLFVCFNSLQWVTLMFVQIRKTLLVREELTACVMHHATGIKKMAKCNQNSVDGYMYMVHWTATIGTMFLMLGSTPALWQVALQLHQKSLPVGQIITVPVLHGRYSITKA